MKNTSWLQLLCVSFFSVMMIACGAQDLKKTPPGSQNEEVNHVEILRQYQRVVRLGCGGVVKSDRIETVKAPTQNVKITPDSYEGLYSSSFFNVRTGSRPAIANHTNFVVDYSSGWLNMHVELGRNVVEYKFYRCSEWQGPPGSQTCKTSSIYERGTVVLDVGYTEEHLGGVRTIDECSAP
jgi:hypothetical protein